MSAVPPCDLGVSLCLCGECSLAGFNHRVSEDHRDRTEDARYPIIAILILIISALTAHAQTKITIDQNTGAAINPEFRFKSVPSPSRNDIATNAWVMIVDGEADPNLASVALACSARPSAPSVRIAAGRASNGLVYTDRAPPKFSPGCRWKTRNSAGSCASVDGPRTHN